MPAAEAVVSVPAKKAAEAEAREAAADVAEHRAAVEENGSYKHPTFLLRDMALCHIPFFSTFPASYIFYR